ncbi:MAG: hypothetical protein FWB80_06975 [Defluviitaleaceae bacterium]|nr:hypothetical protein [Defluviitaleaceae bacterium]
MTQTKPVADRRNKFSEVEGVVNTRISDDTERILDEADHAAAATDTRYTHNEVFSRLKGGINV